MPQRVVTGVIVRGLLVLAAVALASPDGGTAYVTVIGENKVVVIDTGRMEVVKEIPAGQKPWGLVIMSPPESG